MSDYIPTELVDDILVRLPVESLIRFTFVCKTWYSLITSPSFVTKHLNRSKPNAENLLLKIYNRENQKERYLLCRGDKKLCDEHSELEPPLSTPLGNKRILGSCNGLLCMLDYDFPMGIILFNPLIRKSVTLRMPSLPDTSPRWFVWGFGAHPTTHEYILVSIVCVNADSKVEVELYAQGTGSWRSVTLVGHPREFPHFFGCQAFVNGAIHWIAFDGEGVDGTLRSLITLFNLGSQAFSMMMMPAALVSQSPLQLSIMAYGESVAVLCRGQPEEGSCCIWVMKEYGIVESWTNLYNISLLGVLQNNVRFRKSGEVLLSMIDNRLLCYNCETKTLTDTGYTGNSDAFAADSFMESLCLVKRGNGVFVGIP